MSYVFRDTYGSKVENVLSTSVGDHKFKQLVGQYIDRNNTKLHTSGPIYLIPFGDTDKAAFFNLFDVTLQDLKKTIDAITKSISSTAEFKLLRNNPILWLFCLVIRYYDKKKDTRGLNSALAIFALAIYPSVFYKYFPHGADEAVMQYTMDTLSNKFLMKQAGHVFGGLLLSIQNAYDNKTSNSHRNKFKDLSDTEIIAFIQRCRNDQNSMLKNIRDQFQINYNAGNRVRVSRDASIEDMSVDVEQKNNTSIVFIVSQNIVNQIITSGLDLKRVSQCKALSGISLADCRFYLSRIISVKYTKQIDAFVQAILFLYLYDEHKTKEDINSSHFLVWASDLFRKTNSANANIKIIKDTLDLWGEQTGIHDKFKREGSRVNYKKAIFWYFILSIQYYNS